MVLYQTLYEEYNYVALASNAKLVGSHTQSQHQDAGVYQKAQQLGLKSVLQGLQTGTLDPEVQELQLSLFIMLFWCTEIEFDVQTPQLVQVAF